MSEFTVKQLCELIWAAERRFDLLTWKVNGVYLWQAKRAAAFFALAQQASVLEVPHQLPPRGNLNRLKKLTSLLRGTVRGNPLIDREQVDALIFEAQRHTLVDGVYLDIYTYYLAQELAARGVRFHLLDRFYRGRHKKKPDPRRRFLDVMDVQTAVRSRVGASAVPEKDSARIDEVEDYFKQEIGAEVDLFGDSAKELHRFLLEKAFYRRLLEKGTPKEIYCVNSYGGLAPMIDAAKEVGATVIELQHGTVSKYHLGYSFPDQPAGEKLRYFPDKFYVWNDLWKQTIQWPITDENVVCYGNRFFELQRSRCHSEKRKAGQIVILSQGTIGERLSELILEHADALSSHHIVYKLHPGEYQRWRDYKSLVALAKMENVEVVTECDLYRLLAQSEYQIGVYSTAIYEGMAFGLKTILAPLPGMEYTEGLLEENKAVLFHQFIADETGRSG